MADDTTRRGFLKQTVKTAAYVTPAVLTLDVALAEARSGSQRRRRIPRLRRRRRRLNWW